ncbi:hypothetical protein RirG_077360 [Rhizophagus irregularis DAOM 197198w]|uniref:Uncharacterized protein n=1 Tax=Rhizophagus irregularis (strain DAOM 197198w) TaxID=1432141 RepID=A0A015JW55_RHIIW|nr:hypothetical protein RirG_077360 [Rhizophagus irregularis DAOM 197198w]
MANPSITALPEAPQRRMARDVYPAVADKWAAALGPWTTQVNDVVTWMGQQVDLVASYPAAAAKSAKDASDSAVAAGQSLLETTNQAKSAAASAAAAQSAQAATEAAAGNPIRLGLLQSIALCF